MATASHSARDTCAICGQPIAQHPAVPTTRGQLVHVRCADTQARAAYKRRTAHALLSGLVAVAIVAGSATSGLPPALVVLLAVALACGHLALHRRWWTVRLGGWRLGRGGQRLGLQSVHLSWQPELLDSLHLRAVELSCSALLH